MSEQIRQGDVLLEKVAIEPPVNLRAKNQVVLAEGEMTGHCHTLVAPQVYEWEVDGQRYVRVSGGIGTIQHQEHDPVAAPVIEPNTTYRVIPQQEWDLKNQWQKVVD